MGLILVKYFFELLPKNLKSRSGHLQFFNLKVKNSICGPSNKVLYSRDTVDFFLIFVWKKIKKLTLLDRLLNFLIFITLKNLF